LRLEKRKREGERERKKEKERKREEYYRIIFSTELCIHILIGVIIVLILIIAIIIVTLLRILFLVNETRYYASRTNIIIIRLFRMSYCIVRDNASERQNTSLLLFEMGLDQAKNERS